ncbi:MAG: tetratricopeptide repeat protein [Betaproteobacteria bacterium]|jgi:hypothetical protein|nr:tetratricopeptide repeat protein [Betaproteobacteria bacterium]
MQRTPAKARAIAVTLLLALQCAPARADALLDRAGVLLDARAPKAAFELLSPLEPQRAGDPAFDYLLGIAALGIGQPTRAIFALERVLDVRAGDVPARAAIARAYLAVGETENARRALAGMRPEDRPAELAAALDRHGLAPSDPDGVRPRGWQAYLEGRAGHDSNVNSATATSQVAIPALGGQSVTLDPSGTRPQAGFLSIAGGIDLRAPLAHALSLSANAAASRLAHRHEDRFDTATLDAGVGLAWARGPDRVDLALQANRLRLDDRRFRDVAGVVAQWQHAVAPDTRLTAFAQQARLSYPSQPVRDADRGVVGVSVLQAFPASGRTTYASAYAGREDERAGSVPHLGHSLAGLRIGLQWPTVGAGTLYVDAAHERRRHGGPEPSFLAVRRDQQFSISAGLH